jgi:hypothetical protein
VPELPVGPLNLPRELLPQIQDPKDFIRYLNSIGIEWKYEMMPAKDIKSTQSEFNQEKIDSLKKLHKIPDSIYFLSNDDYLLDGHHRWIAQKDKNPEKKIKVIRIKKGILELLNRIVKDHDGSEYKSQFS